MNKIAIITSKLFSDGSGNVNRKQILSTNRLVIRQKGYEYIDPTFKD